MSEYFLEAETIMNVRIYDCCIVDGVLSSAVRERTELFVVLGRGKASVRRYL